MEIQRRKKELLFGVFLEKEGEGSFSLNLEIGQKVSLVIIYRLVVFGFVKGD